MDEVIKRLRQRDLFGDDDYDYDDPRCHYYRHNCCSTWCSWGRWVFVAAVVIAFFLLFSVCACITRRRRSRGLQPYYGTGWMPFHPTNPNGDAQQFHNFPPQHQQYNPNQHYDPNNPHTQYYAPTAPAPPYTPSPQTTGTHFPTPPLPQENQFGYQPPPQGPGNSPYDIRQQSTGGTGGTEYYLPPPGPPPAAHVGKH